MKIILLLIIGLSLSIICLGKDKPKPEDNLVAIFNNAQSIDSVSSRVSNIEETQYIISSNVRVFDTKKWIGEFFADYSTNKNRVDRTGFRFIFKLGESYTDKKIRELETRLNKLEIK